MGICYTVLLLDEFNWEYIGFDRHDVIKQVHNVIPHAELIADAHKVIVFDIDKACPESLIGKITCDVIMAFSDVDIIPVLIWPKIHTRIELPSRKEPIS